MTKILRYIFNKKNSLEYWINYLKTQTYYKIFFKKIGEKSVLFKPLKLSNTQNVILGSNVYIYKGVRIETIERCNFDKYTPVLTIENGVSLEQNCHIIVAGELVIGEETTISANVMIMDVNHSYESVEKSVLRQNLELLETRIGKRCFIGMGAKIMPGTILGNNCIVGANSVVKGKFSNGCVIAGIPATIIKKYDYDKKKWIKNSTKEIK